MATRTRKRRVDFSRKETEELAQKMKHNSTNDELNILVLEWNSNREHVQNDRLIKLESLQNIRRSLPLFTDGEQLWASVAEKVQDEVLATGRKTRKYAPFKGKGVTVKHLNVGKIPGISVNLATSNSSPSTLILQRRNTIFQIGGVALIPPISVSEAISGIIGERRDLFMAQSRTS